MHTEAEIKRAIKPLLDINGELTTSELKEQLHTVLEFDEEDKEKSGSRNEMKIIQRIGNIVSHRDKTNNITYYSEGFILDYTGGKAKFILYNPIEDKKISNEEILKKKEKRKRFMAIKVDWDKVRERNNNVGDQGEEFAMQYEIDRLIENNVENARDIVQHLSRLQGDGLGYDLSSINEDGSTRFIEVKTTTQKLNTPFYMSENEKNFFEIYSEQAFIYRIYDFNLKTRRGKLKIITSNELLNNYNFDPITWKVTPKEDN